MTTLATQQREEPPSDVLRVAGDRKNPFALPQWRRRERVKGRLASILARIGEEGRAADVMACGLARVAYASNGAGIVSSVHSGLPSSIVNECQYRLCPDCARWHARRNNRKVARKIHAFDVHARAVDVACARIRAGDVATGLEMIETLRAAYNASATKGDAAALKIAGIRMLTLTQSRRVGEEAATSLDRFSSAARVLLRSLEWKRRVEGGVMKIEIERSTEETRHHRARILDHRAGRARHNARTDPRRRGRWQWLAEKLEAEAHDLRARGHASWWHVHAHLLVIGGYWKQASILELWRDCMKRSTFEVNVRATSGADDDKTTPTKKPKHDERQALLIPLSVDEDLRQRFQSTSKEQRARKRTSTTDDRPRHKRIVKRPWYPDDCEEDLRVRAGTLKAYGGARIEAPREASGVKELTKYVTKPLSFEDLDEDCAEALVRALRGRRVLRTFGCLYGLKLDEDEAPTAKTEGCDDTADDAGDPVVGCTDDGADVRRSEIVWRDDDAAREERRWRREMLWDAHNNKTGPPCTEKTMTAPSLSSPRASCSSSSAASQLRFWC